MTKKENMLNVFMPSLGMVLVTGDKNALSTGKVSCLFGISARCFMTYNLKTTNSCQSVSAIYIAGIEPDAVESLKVMPTSTGIERNGHQGFYALIDKVDTADFEGLSKLVYNFEPKENICRGLKYCQVGLNQTIQISECGDFKGGWYTCDPRKYLAYGFEGFGNPLIWNKVNVGFTSVFEFVKNLELHAHYGCQNRGAAQANNSPDITTNNRGIFSPNTPSICDVSCCYSSKNNKCPFECVLGIQSMNEGGKSTQTELPTGKVVNNWTAVYENIPDYEIGSKTDACVMALARHLTQSQYTNACTGILATKPFKDTEISGACSFANIDVDNNNSTIISKWSIGCSTRSFMKGFCKESNCISQIALNIGTPAYLSKSYTTKLTTNNTEKTIDADSAPIICELGYSFVYGGFNIPLFISYYANVNGRDSEDFTNESTVNACICGIRPNRLITSLGTQKTKTFLPCVTEGGLYIEE